MAGAAAPSCPRPSSRWPRPCRPPLAGGPGRVDGGPGCHLGGVDGGVSAVGPGRVHGGWRGRPRWCPRWPRSPRRPRAWWPRSCPRWPRWCPRWRRSSRLSRRRWPRPCPRWRRSSRLSRSAVAPVVSMVAPVMSAVAPVVSAAAGHVSGGPGRVSGGAGRLGCHVGGGPGRVHGGPGRVGGGRRGGPGRVGGDGSAEPGFRRWRAGWGLVASGRGRVGCWCFLAAGAVGGGGRRCAGAAGAGVSPAAGYAGRRRDRRSATLAAVPAGAGCRVASGRRCRRGRRFPGCQPCRVAARAARMVSMALAAVRRDRRGQGAGRRRCCADRAAHAGVAAAGAWCRGEAGLAFVPAGGAAGLSPFLPDGPCSGVRACSVRR